MLPAGRKLSRRTMLRGAGVAMSLPMLEAMLPGGARAAQTAGNDSEITRLAYIYMPGPLGGGDRAGAKAGHDCLRASLEPLTSVRQHVTVLPTATLDSPGQLAGLPRPAAFMQASPNVEGAAGTIGATADQVAASYVGRVTLLQSLELETGTREATPHCPRDQGPLDHMSWESASRPRPGQWSPRRVFDLLFGDAEQATHATSHESVLDRVEGRRKFVAALGIDDQHRVEAYFESIRRVEQQIDVVERELPSLGAAAVPAAMTTAEVRATHIIQTRLLFDLLLLAYQADATRIATLQFRWPGAWLADEASIGYQRESLAAVAQFIEKLATTLVGGTSLLEQTYLLLGSSDGDTMPLLVAGGDRRLQLAAPRTTLAEVHHAVLDCVASAYPRTFDGTAS